MKILDKDQFLEQESFFLGEIKNGKIFIYPTDTIYGIGCIATNSEAIKKIRKIKHRDERPFSIIVPSKSWISKNCEISKENIPQLEKLPGPYTLILKLKNPQLFPKELTDHVETLGVRIPNNWFSSFLQKNNLAFITTSVNIAGEPHLVDIKDLKEEIADQVDYIIDDGPLKGKPSMIIDLTKEEIKVTRH